MAWIDVKARADRVQERIWALERKHLDVLCEDPDYNAYCERRERLGRTERMTIDGVHYWLDKMREIEAGEPSDPDEARSYWRKHGPQHERACKYLLFS